MVLAVFQIVVTDILQARRQPGYVFPVTWSLADTSLFSDFVTGIPAAFQIVVTDFVTGIPAAFQIVVTGMLQAGYVIPST